MTKAQAWRFLFAVLIALTSATLGAQSPPQDLQINNVWARATAPGLPTGAVYFELTNPSARGDHLIGVRSARAPRAEIHQTIESGGNSRMQHTPRVRIPAHASVHFAPAGRHIMLMGLTQALSEGEQFDLTLVFEDAGAREVRVNVLAPTAMDSNHGSHPSDDAQVTDP